MRIHKSVCIESELYDKLCDMFPHSSFSKVCNAVLDDYVSHYYFSVIRSLEDLKENNQNG